MKKFFILLAISIVLAGVINAQGAANPIQQMDSTIKTLAEEINRKLISEKTDKISLGQFIYSGAIPQFSSYLTNQLSEELINIPNRSFTMISGGSLGANIIISGEIVNMASLIRVYTHLVRQDSRVIVASFHRDFEQNEYIAMMLYVNDSYSGNYFVPIDAYEPDSMENPVPYEIGIEGSTLIMSRSITRGDQDFFLLTPDRNGLLIAETFDSDIDTYIEFYDADSREKLGENDDGGENFNARIVYNVQAGRSYIVKVRGYSRDATGPYNFRAFFSRSDYYDE